MFVDSDWDKKVFNSNLSKEREVESEQEVVLEEEGVECLESSTRGQKRQTEKEQETNKKRKVEAKSGLIWGEQMAHLSFSTALGR